jgi:hypothetical protein
MDERLAELKKLVTLVEATSAAPGTVPTKEELVVVAELVTTCGRILTSEVNKDGGSILLRPWRKIIGHILMAIAEWLLD